MKELMWVDYLVWAIVVVILIVIIGVSVKSCNSGSKDSDYQELCIRGNLYYRSNFMHKMGLSIALDDEGKPIPCEVKND